MSTAWEEMSRPPEIASLASGGTHAAYFFKDSAEKQRRLFQLSLEFLDGRSFVLYIAGKQGTKGIRLSMKDSRIDVAGYERQKKLRIVDSEEWYLTSGRATVFKTPESIAEQFQISYKEATQAGNEALLVISETDQLVRKGFVQQYLEFEKTASAIVDSKISFLCAYDERELGAAHTSSDSIARLHGHTLT